MQRMQISIMPNLRDHFHGGLGNCTGMVVVAEERNMICFRNDQEAAVRRDHEPMALLSLVPIGTLRSNLRICVNPFIGRDQPHRQGPEAAQCANLGKRVGESLRFPSTKSSGA